MEADIRTKEVGELDARQWFNPTESLLSTEPFALNSGKAAGLYEGLLKKDNITAKHSEGVATLCFHMANFLTFKGEKLLYSPQEAYLAGLLHDIGKLEMPDDVLKSSKIINQPDQNEYIRDHPYNGYKILHKLRFPDKVTTAVLYHHERWDGSGYPDGLVGNTIDDLAQLIGIADTYDALVHKRRYREAVTPKEALEIMEKEKHLFSPRLLKVFMDYMNTDTEEITAPSLTKTPRLALANE